MILASLDCSLVAWEADGRVWWVRGAGAGAAIATAGPADQLGFSRDGGLWMRVGSEAGARAVRFDVDSGRQAVVPHPVLAVAAGGGLDGAVLATAEGIRWWDGRALQVVSTDARDRSPAVHPRDALIAFQRGGQAIGVHVQVEGGFQRGSELAYFRGRADCDGLAWTQRSLVGLCGGAAVSGTRNGELWTLGPATTLTTGDERILADTVGFTWDGKPLPAPTQGAICHAADGYRLATVADGTVAFTVWSP